jgi:hypothetical protein
MFQLIHSFNYFSNAVWKIYTSVFCVTQEMCIITASTQISDGNLLIHHVKNRDATLWHRKFNTHCIQEIFSSKWKDCEGEAALYAGMNLSGKYGVKKNCINGANIVPVSLITTQWDV